MKFLVIRFSSIGDIVLTSPVVRCLKKQLPGVEVHYLTKNVFASILRANPYIDKLHTLSHSWEQMIHELNLEEYDHIIDLHHNLRTLRLKSTLAKPAHSFNKLNTRKWIYVNFKLNLMPGVHIVDRYMDTLKTFGVKNDGAGLDYFIPENETVPLSDIPASHHAGFIGIAIGAAHNTKKMPVHKYIELCRRLDHPVILMGGKEDIPEANQISAIDPVRIYNACGKFSITESADLVRRSRIVITHDTGLMHIAAAFKKPVISIWGNTVPSFGMYPYYGNNFLANHKSSPYDVIQVNKLWCRPCSKLGYARCPLKHFKCMEKHSIDEILSCVQTRLSSPV